MASPQGINNNQGWSLFGWEFRKTPQANTSYQNDVTPTQKSFAMPSNDDGAVTLQTGAYFGTYVDLEGVVRNEVELITRYREMAMQPEMEAAIDDITNEAIVTEDNGHSVDINCDNIGQSAKIKDLLREEFKHVLKLLDFGNSGHDIFRRWYIDGRLFYHAIINELHPELGIQELRYIDPRRIRKIREIQKAKDPKTGADVIKNIQEYYLYNERGVIGAHSNLGTRITADSVININSGLMDSRRAMVLSYLHKAIKPLNMLRMIEDATIIYRISRAPERRVFYIDTGNLPKVKAEQYVQDIMVKYRNKLVYDSTTGELRDDRKFQSMIEDFWLPRREGTKGTEIQTLQGGQNLGKMEDVEYFQRKLYQALSVPVGRLIPQEGFSLGRSSEVTRDEVKFSRFISRLRGKFSGVFDEIMGRQVVLKGICTQEEWKIFKEDIWWDFLKDNNFEELKEADLLTSRLQLLGVIDPYVGAYFSREWVRKKILKQTDEEMADQDAQIKKEKLGPVNMQNQLELMDAQADIQKDLASNQAELDGQQEQEAPQGPEGSLEDKFADGTGNPRNGDPNQRFGAVVSESKKTINTLMELSKEVYAKGKLE